jgi:hypothetical protein
LYGFGVTRILVTPDCRAAGDTRDDFRMKGAPISLMASVSFWSGKKALAVA